MTEDADSDIEPSGSEHQARLAKARAMGGPLKLAARRQQGQLNARERVDALLDPGSFVESGLLAVSHRPGMAEQTPADGKVTGFGNVHGCTIAVAANDFTVMGASSSRVNARKIRHVKRVATARGLPMVFLGESTGARMPDAMGANGVAGGDDPTQYLRQRESPWASGVLGPCYGSSAWYASMSDFVVMRSDATMAVSSPRLIAMATSEEVDPDELGGWRVHAMASGLVDTVVDTDEEAIALIRRFLTYVPANNGERAPEAAIPDGSDDPARGARIRSILPESPSRAYDMRRLLECFVDEGSMFELKPMFGKSLVTSLARVNGQVVGLIANNPMFRGGAIDPDACSKATSFIVFCDSFNIPLVFLADQPGFLIGKDGERKGATGRVINWMNALALCTVPKIAIVVRKTYGQALLNMGLGGNADEACAWTTAEIGFMDPRFGAQIVYGRGVLDDPDRAASALEEMGVGTSAYDAAAAFTVQTVIEPEETRRYLTDALDVHWQSHDRVGRHLLCSWPTTVF